MALSASEPNPQLVARRKSRRDGVDDCVKYFIAGCSLFPQRPIQHECRHVVPSQHSAASRLNGHGFAVRSCCRRFAANPTNLGLLKLCIDDSLLTHETESCWSRARHGITASTLPTWLCQSWNQKRDPECIRRGRSALSRCLSHRPGDQQLADTVD